MKFYKTPNIIQSWFSKAIWRLEENRTESIVYLTFDDGPHPEASQFVLDQLKAFNAKATFFCLGVNIEKYPKIFDQIKKDGHSIGNHTYNHLSGWSTSNATYYENIAKCQKATKTNLFRPPYGRLSYTQYLKLSKEYNVVYWDVLTYDFDKNLNQMEAMEKLKKSIRPGSIIVMHDSTKAFGNLKVLLPALLKYLSNKGFLFEGLNEKEDLKTWKSEIA